MMGALSNIDKKVCEYDHEGNSTDHRPIHDRRQRAEKTEKKMERNTEYRWQLNRSNTPDLTPTQNDWSNNIYFNQ